MTTLPSTSASLWFFSLMALTTSGCSTAKYLWQAAGGQLELLNRARPIEEVIRDERTAPRLRALLAEVPAIKKYGETLGIQATPNYRDFVELNRPAAVWVVSACRELKFESKEWRFPIVGKIPYLGWFSREKAQAFADQIARDGWDVDVRGASAYSTLGWFPDAILSTMISNGDEALGELVNVVIHESVHATVYLKGQAYFNESLASFIADRVTPGYLEALKGKGAVELEAYRRAERDGESRMKRLHEVYSELQALYDNSAISDDEKRARKKAVFAKTREELKIKREISNATLVQYKTYRTGASAFDDVLKRCGGDWKRFLKRMREVKSGHFPTSQSQELETVLKPFANECPENEA